jgi:ABC-type transporter MlaC component
MSKQVIEIYARHEKRNGLKNSQYHREQLQEWLSSTAETFKSGNSKEKLDSLTSLMRLFCRKPGVNESSGLDFDPCFEDTHAVNGLHSAQKVVLKIIARQIKKLDPDDQHALLKDFIEKHLENMGHSTDAAHDPQRKAIKMLGELPPTLKMKPTHRAALTNSLFRKLSTGQINMADSVMGIFNRKKTQTSDMAAQVVGKELRSISRKHSKIDDSIRNELQQTYNRAMLDYSSQGNKSTKLHTDAWKKAFNNRQLNPNNWTEKQLKRLSNRQVSAFDSLRINTLEVVNAQLLEELKNSREKQGTTNSKSREDGGYRNRLGQSINTGGRRPTLSKSGAAGEYGYPILEGYSNRPPLHKDPSSEKVPHLQSSEIASDRGLVGDRGETAHSSPLLPRPTRKLQKRRSQILELPGDNSPLPRGTSVTSQNGLARTQQNLDQAGDQPAEPTRSTSTRQGRLSSQDDIVVNQPLEDGVSNTPPSSSPILRLNETSQLSSGPAANVGAATKPIIERLRHEHTARSLRDYDLHRESGLHRGSNGSRDTSPTRSLRSHGQSLEEAQVTAASSTSSGEN